MLHHVHVFFCVWSKRLYFWKNLTAHYVEDHLVSLEQQTNFDFRIGRCSCSRSPLAMYETPRATGSPDPSNVSLFFIFCQNVGIDCRNLTTNVELLLCTHSPNQYLKFARAWHFHINARASFVDDNMYFFDRPTSASGTDSCEGIVHLQYC